MINYKEVKLDKDHTLFEAPKGYIFIHNEKGIELYGESLIIHNERDPYTVDDFKLIEYGVFNKMKDKFLSGDDK
jgi:hypothetical protein